LIISHWVLLIMRNVSDKSCRENQTKHFTFIFKLCHLCECGKILYSMTGHRWQCNTVHGLCMLDSQDYKLALRRCNTYCFSIATMVAWMGLNVVLHIHCWSCPYYLSSNLTEYWWSVCYKFHMLNAVLQNNNCSLYPIISVLVDRTELKAVWKIFSPKIPVGKILQFMQWIYAGLHSISINPGAISKF
jgi:hypothetical protein